MQYKRIKNILGEKILKIVKQRYYMTQKIHSVGTISKRTGTSSQGNSYMSVFTAAWIMRAKKQEPKSPSADEGIKQNVIH